MDGYDTAVAEPEVVVAFGLLKPLEVAERRDGRRGLGRRQKVSSLEDGSQVGYILDVADVGVRMLGLDLLNLFHLT